MFRKSLKGFDDSINVSADTDRPFNPTDDPFIVDQEGGALDTEKTFFDVEFFAEFLVRVGQKVEIKTIFLNEV